DDETEDVGDSPTAKIAEGRSGHHEHRHRDAVRSDDPLESRLTGVKVALNVRKGDVHDRGVEEDHEQAKPSCQQCPRGASTGGRGGHPQERISVADQTEESRRPERAWSRRWLRPPYAGIPPITCTSVSTSAGASVPRRDGPARGAVGRRDPR